MLRKINAALAVVIVAIGIYQMFNDDFMINPVIVLPIITLMFLLFGIESVQNKRKTIAAIYFAVFVIALVITIVQLTQG